MQLNIAYLKSALYSYVLIGLLLFVIIYLLYKYIKILRHIAAFQKASEILGIGLFIFNKAYRNITSFNSMSLDCLDNTKKHNLLEYGEDFCLLDAGEQKWVKGAIKYGQAYIGSLNINSEALHQYHILEHLPFIACVIDKEANIIFANNLYYKIANKDKICVFSKRVIDSGQVNLSIDGAIHYFKIDSCVLDSGYKLLCVFDITKHQNLEQRLDQTMLGYRQSLDLISIAVSIFDKNQKLIFYNEAFVQLFDLDEDFIKNLPSHSALLEKLRAAGKLPIIPDWQSWRADLFNIYSNLEAQQHKWHLPDGTTLRVIAHAQPQGGICWIYENLTPMLDMQLRYNSLIAHQGDTLDNLLEGIVLFDSSGKILLSNPAFTALWGLEAEFGIQGTHINILVEHLKRLSKETSLDVINNLPGYITGFCDKRELKRGHIELKDGRILEYSICPMRLGQNMLLFIDITAKITVQRVLAEKNEALLLSDKLRNGFVRNVSYDLLTPLTSIDGFTQLMLSSDALNLNKKAKEYLGDIAIEAQKLNNMIQDMIDLASLNAGIMQLEVEEVNIKELCLVAYNSAQTLLLANNIGFDLNYKINDLEFYGDKKRIKQLLTSILSYCALHAPHNKAIELKVTYSNKFVYFKFIAADLVHDLSNEVHSQIELPLARSICELCSGTLEFIKEQDSEIIICSLPSLK